MDVDATIIVTFEVDGCRCVYENFSFLHISLKEIGYREVQYGEGDVVSVSSYVIAPERFITILFPSQKLKENLLSCQTYIWNKLTAELGYSPPFRTIALLGQRLVEIADDDDEEDGLLDEQVTSRRRTSKTAKASGRFINADHHEKKKELGRCCICLEEMSCGKEQLQLVGLPCKHVFHENCLLQWLDNTNSCPLCRTPLED